MENFKKLRKLFGRKEKIKFLLLFILMIFAALFETLGIGLIVPFVGIITNPESIHESPVLSRVYEMLDFQSTTAFLIVATIGLLVIFVLKNAYLVWFHYIQYKVIFNEQVKMSKRLLKAYLSKPYTFHLQRNSADLVRNANIEVQRVFRAVIKPIFLVLTELLIVSSIFTLLLIMAPIPTIISVIILGGSVWLFFRKFRDKITKSGVELQESQAGMIKWVQQALGAGKEVKVSGREKFFVDAYTEQSKKYADNSLFHSIIRIMPRMFIETIVIATILLIILVIMIQANDTETLIGIISLFAMAAFRLMPSINRMTGALTGIRHSQPSLDVIYNDLIIEEVEKAVDDEIFEEKPTIINLGPKTFEKSIDVENVSFSYPNAHEDAIIDVSLSIPIGKSVAFVGETGSGKTTMVDIILGVLQPYKGNIKIDGKLTKDIWKLWQRKIGYIPQFIYLSDDSIRNNIAFGIADNDIDDKAVWNALEKAQLKTFVEGLPNQLDTYVGERGVRLSGGQRQRIGIARALYHNPEILFMDEATSALDNETEKGIMKSIDALRGEKTLIIIAHRLSTIENCDIIYEMKAGRLDSVRGEGLAINSQQ